MVYGLYPSKAVPKAIAIRQALTLKTRIVFLKQSARGTGISYGRTYTLRRESLVATIPIGYGDGYPRLLSNRGEGVVRGARVPVIGRVCMDQTLIDVTDVEQVAEGDEVTLYGGGHGFLGISEIAEKIGTIPNDILCALGSRVPRVHVNG